MLDAEWKKLLKDVVDFADIMDYLPDDLRARIDAALNSVTLTMPPGTTSVRVQEISPDVVMLKIIQISGSKGISFSDLLTKFRHENNSMLFSRTRNMLIRRGLIQTNGKRGISCRYTCTLEGVRFIKEFESDPHTWDVGYGPSDKLDPALKERGGSL